MKIFFKRFYRLNKSRQVPDSGYVRVGIQQIELAAADQLLSYISSRLRSSTVAAAKPGQKDDNVKEYCLCDCVKWQAYQ